MELKTTSVTVAVAAQAEGAVKLDPRTRQVHLGSPLELGLTEVGRSFLCPVEV